jgi:FtsH-binding integral membrane protein
MPDEPASEHVDIASWVGTALWIILLESHIISRPLVFLLGPLVMLSCIFIIASPIPPNRRRRLFLFAAVTSVAGFLLTEYVFR